MEPRRKRIIFFHSPKKYLTAAIILIGVVNVAIALLSLVTDLGAFDMLSYGFARFHGANRDKFTDLYEYSKFKYEKRHAGDCSYGPYLLIGALGIVVSIILSLFI